MRLSCCTRIPFLFTRHGSICVPLSHFCNFTHIQKDLNCLNSILIDEHRTSMGLLTCLVKTDFYIRQGIYTINKRCLVCTLDRLWLSNMTNTTIFCSSSWTSRSQLYETTVLLFRLYYRMWHKMSCSVDVSRKTGNAYPTTAHGPYSRFWIKSEQLIYSFYLFMCFCF